MRTHIIYIVTTALTLLLATAMPATAQEPKAIYYSRWPQLTSQQLVRLGDSLRNVRHLPDSALACYSLVANRYYDGSSLSKDDKRSVVEALISISSLWLDTFRDYPKALQYAMQAQIAAKKFGLSYYQPSITVMMATIESYKPVVDGNYSLRPDVLNLYKQAFHQAVEQKNWNALKKGSIDLLSETAFKKKNKLISGELQQLRQMKLSKKEGWLPVVQEIIRGLDVWEPLYESGEWKRLSHERQCQLADSAVGIFRGTFGKLKLMDPADQTSAGMFLHFFIAMAYQDSHQDEKLISELKLTEQYAKEHNLTEGLVSAYMNEWVYYNHHGPKELAQEYRIKLLETRINMIDNNGLGQVGSVKLAYDVQEKNEEVRQMAYKRQMERRILWGVIAFSLVIVVISLLLLHKYRQLKESNRQLYQRMNQLLQAEEDLVSLTETTQAASDNPEATPEQRPKYGKSALPQKEQSDLLHRVIIVMETSPEVYSEDFTLDRLARLADGKRNAVSQVINDRYKTNFNGMLNEYRIKEACRRMNDQENYGNYTIEAIAQSVGFKSRSNFGAVFKRITGLTPSVYKQMAEE